MLAAGKSLRSATIGAVLAMRPMPAKSDGLKDTFSWMK